MLKLAKMNDSIPIFTSVDQVIRDTYTYLGIDTEMRFAVNGKTVWPHLEGLKQERSNFERSADWHGDGYAFELCTLPAYCLETLHLSLCQGFREILQVLKDRHSNASEEDILALPNCLFKVPMSVQDSAPDVVKRLGCSASMNVYGDAGDPDKLGQSVRTTGCHLHITHDSLNDDEKLVYALVRWADILVGNTWNFISPESSKKEALRRVAYGRAGEFRTRTYPATRYSCKCKGVEYRVLPGTIMQNPVYLTLSFNLYRTALRFALTYGRPPDEVTEITRHAINTADKAASKDVLDWLPFEDNARTFLALLQQEPLEVWTPAKWSQNASLYGHRWLAKEKHLF